MPWIAAREALRRGEDVRLFTFTDEKLPDDLVPYQRQVVLTQMFASVMKTMKKEKIERLLLLGKATRDVMYNKPRFDLKTIYILATMANQNDTTIFLTLAKHFAKAGIEVISQLTYLQEMFLPYGRYGKKCSSREIEDISYGMVYAKEMTRLDVGQTIVAGQKTVLAVECAEGTDQCIRRGGELFKNRGAVVCKAARANHDTRFDVPVIGASTLESMKASGCRVLAIEGKMTFVVRPREFVEMAAQYGITVVSLDPADAGLKSVKKLTSREAKVK